MKKIFKLTIISVLAVSLLISCENKTKDEVYKVGDIGPAGGWIIYVNDYYNANSSDNNWKYLEAAPDNLVVGENTQFIFGFYRKAPDSSNSMVVSNTTQNVMIGKGSSNTTALVNAMKDAAYCAKDTSDSSTTKDYAAKLCNEYSVKRNGATYKGWFLPSKEELNLMYTYLKTEGKGGTWLGDGYYYLSSSESNGDCVWGQNFETGNQEQYISREGKQYIRPVRAF